MFILITKASTSKKMASMSVWNYNTGLAYASFGHLFSSAGFISCANMIVAGDRTFDIAAC